MTYRVRPQSAKAGHRDLAWPLSEQDRRVRNAYAALHTGRGFDFESTAT